MSPAVPSSSAKTAPHVMGASTSVWLWVAVALAGVATALPGAGHGGLPAAPWELLTEPLGGTWLALMTLLTAAALLLLTPGRWRGTLGLLLGGVATWLTADAMGVAIGSGRIDASPVLAHALSGPVAGRVMLLVVLGGAFGALLWSLGHASKRARVSVAACAWLLLVVLAVVAPLGYDGKAMPAAPLVAFAEALGSGGFTGDRIGALWMFVGLGVAAVPAIAHGVYDRRVAATVAVWATLGCLVLLSLGSVALLSAPSSSWGLALEALKFAVSLTAALTLFSGGLAGVARAYSPSSSASLLSNA